MRVVAEVDGEIQRIEVVESRGRLSIRVGDAVWEVDARWPSRDRCSLLIGGVSYVADLSEEGGQFLVDLGGARYRVRVEEETRHRLRTRGGGRGGEGGQVLVAPMPGKVVHVAVSAGQTLKAGDALVVIEAMKMENEFRATGPGTVKEVRVQAGQAVNAGDVLVVIE